MCGKSWHTIKATAPVLKAGHLVSCLCVCICMCMCVCVWWLSSFYLGGGFVCGGLGGGGGGGGGGGSGLFLFFLFVLYS